MNTLDTPLFPLTKSERAQYVEDVHGIIIGDHTVTARLYSKKTRNQVASSGGLENDEAARAWAKDWVEKAKVEQGAEFKRLWGTEGFELRIWD